MRKIFICFIFFYISLFFGTSCKGVTSGDNPQNDTPQNNTPQNNTPQNNTPQSSTITDAELPSELATYFSSRLASDAYQDFGKDLFFSASDVDDYRNKVWDAWKTANNGFREKKLPALSTISKTNTSHWAVKKGLGTADYNMEFAYGYRGTLDPGWTRAIIYLHGSGDDSAEWDGAFTLANSVNNSIFFMPRWTTRGTDYNKWYRREKTKLWEKVFRLLMLDENVNPNQIFLTGVSEGGYGSQRMASFYADYLAGEPLAPLAKSSKMRHSKILRTSSISCKLEAETKATIEFSKQKLRKKISKN